GAMQAVIERCAALHLDHICRGGDPFELGSSRPLDFGHWSAHKLEALSGFRVGHGQAVAIGLALDVTYAWLAGLLCEADRDRVLKIIEACGLPTTHPLLTEVALLDGLAEFQEHLGGRLTITLLRRIGESLDVHEMDHGLIAEAAALLSLHSAAPLEVIP
ncbi:MAG TPA: hypothetical protein VE571_13750, partial [Solirubrobacteraceae bacterium]|nr:hypothetical protein [Solirubrobacteraceae bacterium]